MKYIKKKECDKKKKRKEEWKEEEGKESFLCVEDGKGGLIFTNKNKFYSSSEGVYIFDVTHIITNKEIKRKLNIYRTFSYWLLLILNLPDSNWHWAPSCSIDALWNIQLKSENP
jgi:hypothetical protein